MWVDRAQNLRISYEVGHRGHFSGARSVEVVLEVWFILIATCILPRSSFTMKTEFPDLRNSNGRQFGTLIQRCTMPSPRMIRLALLYWSEWGYRGLDTYEFMK